MPTKKTLLICDLDGTLIDSFPGIAEAVRMACSTVGIEPALPIDASLVGVPLDAMLAAVSGPLDAAECQRFRTAFVDAYDGGACMLSEPFDGVDQMLESVRQHGHDLALATNKRLVPTRTILRARGWDRFFEITETTDSLPGQARTKTQMLVALRAIIGRDPQGTAYLGDTEADLQAARAAGVRFILAGWGYGAGLAGPGIVSAATPAVVRMCLSHAFAT